MASSKSIEKIILKYVNKSRKKRGINPLKSNFGLRRVARAHSKHMARVGKIWHGHGVHIAKDRITYPKGFLGFLMKIFTPYTYSSGGENVAMIGGKFKSSKLLANKFHKMWMKSPGHKRNILDSNFSKIGIGVKKGRRGYFATELFYG